MAGDDKGSKKPKGAGKSGLRKGRGLEPSDAVVAKLNLVDWEDDLPTEVGSALDRPTSTRRKTGAAPREADAGSGHATSDDDFEIDIDIDDLAIDVEESAPPATQAPAAGWADSSTDTDREAPAFSPGSDDERARSEPDDVPSDRINAPLDDDGWPRPSQPGLLVVSSDSIDPTPVPRGTAGDGQLADPGPRRTWTEELRRSEAPMWENEATHVYEAEIDSSLATQRERRKLSLSDTRPRSGRPSSIPTHPGWQEYYLNALSGSLYDVREVFTASVTADPLVTPLSAPESVVASRYRILGHRVEEVAAQEYCRTIAVTSSHAGEGKTVTAINLAMVLAEEPHRQVCLVDANLRRPAIADRLGIQDCEGILGVFLGRIRLPEAMVRFGSRELYLLPAGGAYSNPTQLLRSGVFRAILRRLEEEFDYVIVDCPPILPMADIEMITRLVDRVVVVVQAGKTSDSTLVTALRRLDEEQLLGLVLNECAA